MNPQIEYYIYKIISKIRKEKRKESLNKWFVKKGVHLELTDNSEQWININSNIAKNEPHLIYIGHSTTIGGGRICNS